MSRLYDKMVAVHQGSPRQWDEEDVQDILQMMHKIRDMKEELEALKQPEKV